MKIRKLFIGLAAGAAALGVGGGVAFAAWSVSGTGSGGGAATVAQSLVVTEITPTGAAASLYPGGSGPVYFTIQNPNPFAVTVTGLTWGTATSNNTTACPNANVTVDSNAPTSVSIPVAANSTTGAEQENGVLDMNHAAPNGCEGVSFNVGLTVAATQQ